MSADFLTFDLLEVREFAAGSGIRDQDLTEVCTCGCSLDQQHDRCPDCGRPYCWINSPAWRRLFGNADSWARQYKDLVPKNEAEFQVVRYFGHRGLFTSETQRDIVRGVIARFGQAWIIESLGFKKRVPGVPFESWLTHVRNNAPERAPVEHEAIETGPTMTAEEAEANKQKMLALLREEGKL